MGWKIDFEKLHKYLRGKFGVSKIYYFGGVEIHKFSFDYLTNDTVSLADLEKYLIDYVEKNSKSFTNVELTILERHLKQVRFYKKLEEFKYKLVLKPVKIYEDEAGSKKRKANCDVEMAFYLMRDRGLFGQVLVLSGDGDFLPVLKYLRNVDEKKVMVLASGLRTAKEIRRFAGDKFMDFTYLREHLKRTDL